MKLKLSSSLIMKTDSWKMLGKIEGLREGGDRECSWIMSNNGAV